MKALFASSVLLLTIFLAFSIGIAVGYAVICGILNAFGHRREKATAAAQLAASSSLGD